MREPSLSLRRFEFSEVVCRLLVTCQLLSHRMVVLMVEDETLVRILLDEVGFKVFEGVNAGEALTVLQARPDVQVVVTDIEMPAGSMNGLKLARTIHERWPGVGIAVTSRRERPGPGDLSDKVAFLTKPYLPNTIIIVIRQMTAPQVVVPPVAQSA